MSTRSRAPWAEWEIALLRDLYPDVEAHVIAWFVNRELHAIYRKARQLQLQKSREFVAAVSRERFDASHPARRFCFQKGQAPMNKGKKGVSHPRSVPTQFRPGQKPGNWMPIGSERVTHDGYRQVKLTDTGYPPRDWVELHRLVWVAMTGQPLPKGGIVAFRDRNKLNCDPSNLELISFTENMRRNTIARYSPELRSAIKASHKLKRAIHEKQNVRPA
jgi:hypothetical protein